MRALSALVLFTISAVLLHAPPSRAMQPEPTPPSAESRAFCTLEEEDSGEAFGIFDPDGENVSVADANDVEQPETTDESRRFTGNLRMNFLTLPPATCLAGSLFYPAALITVTAGTIEIFVEPGPGGPVGAPAPEGTIRRTPNGDPELLVLPGPITVETGQWVALENRAIVGFRNHGDADATILVAGIHPTSGDGSGGCQAGCRSRP